MTPTTALPCHPVYLKVLTPALGEGAGDDRPLESRTGPMTLFVPKADDWLNSNTRPHRMVKANRVKSWRAAARAAVPSDWEAFEEPVRIEAHIWKNRRGRYDPNNLNDTTKACVDGFVDAGLLVDDDWNHVIGPDHRHGGIGQPGIIFLFELVLKSTDSSK